MFVMFFIRWSFIAIFVQMSLCLTVLSDFDFGHSAMMWFKFAILFLQNAHFFISGLSLFLFVLAGVSKRLARVLIKVW